MRSGVFLVLSVLAGAFALRLFRLDAQSLWWDETFAAETATRSLRAILSNTAEFHPPLFYALLHLWWPLVGRTEFALRFFSLAANLLTVAVLARLGRSMAGPIAGLVVAAFAGLSPLYVYYSQELRMYAPETLAVAALLAFAWNTTRGKGKGERGQLAHNAFRFSPFPS